MFFTLVEPIEVVIGIKMLRKFLLCLLVGLSVARQNSPAWKENTEYTYDVRGRSLSSLRISDEYSGILLRAKFIVQPQANGNLRCKVSNPEYVDFQANLPEGWMHNVSDSELTYNPLEISQKPFEVALKNGVVKELVMEQEVSQWEANIIKSFVSQLQLDTQAENVKPSEYNILPKEGSNNAAFKVIEDTVTGISETTYDIHPMPEYMLQSKPHLAPFPHLKGDGSIIEIVKNKNFSRGYHLPSYHYRLGKSGSYQPESNQLGQLVHRNSMGRSVITGTLQRYTIQYSETVNEVILSVKADKRASVNSMMSMKLVNAEQQSNKLPEISSPVHVGSLVYAYEKQQSGNKVTSGKMFQSSEYEMSESDESSEHLSSYAHKRHPRSLNPHSSPDSSVEPKSSISESPRFPLLPLFVGNKGQSIKQSSEVHIVEDAYTMTQEIGEEIENPQEIPIKKTLSKFVILTQLLRTMNEDELKQVAQRFYTQETRGPKYNSWVVFRDAVAETGTGPAFMMIKYFIESQKIQGEEAAMVVSSMSESVRVPTEEYIRKFYELVKTQMNNRDDSSTSDEAMLFSLSSLIYKVYVDPKFSHREYPTHSFGKFDTESGKAFVRDEVIPFITSSMREAINKGDSQKIYAYIRALGEIGHPKILHSFEPYLEGKVPCSQFQRLLMVLSLYRVAPVEPKLARTVLYRIYQNIGETTEIRVASVYMLMYTSPPTEMLQRIAKYTKIESNHRVCAAVKSAILSAAQLEGSDYADLRSAAESASHFLTKKNFGVPDSQEFSYTQAFHSWESYYRHVLQTVVSEESGIPSSFYYSFSGKGNGLKYDPFSLQSVVSDIRNLYYVLQKQTTWYDQQESQQDSSQQIDKSAWTSYKIAQLLNFQSPELEQLEGGLFVHLGELRKHWIFNNRSVEKLPKILHQALRSVENGKTIKYTTLLNNNDAALAFPTEIGVPFVGSYDLPILVNVEGTVQFSSQPKIAPGGKLRIPETAQMETDLKITISVQKRDEFGFFTPFNHKQYSAGYDKNIHIYLPIRAKATVDLKNYNVEYEVEPTESVEKVKMLHFSSWPYITRYDLLNIKSATQSKNVHQVHRPTQSKIDVVVGDKSVGMAFRVKYENDGSQPNIKSMIQGFFEDATQHEFLSVEYVPELSQNKKVQGTVTYMNGQQKEYQVVDRKAILSSLAQLSGDESSRASQMMKYAPFGISNADVNVIDSKIKFTGDQNVEYVVSLAYARNQENSQTRALAYVNKKSQISGSKPFQFAAIGQFDKARYSGLDVKYVLNSDLLSHAYVDVAFGESQQSENQIEFHAQSRRSDARKVYLLEDPSYQKCSTQMQRGNKQLLACANVTQMAGLLDLVDINMNYPQLKSRDLHNALSLAQKYVKNIDVDHYKQSQLQQGEFTAKVRFSPDLQHVNASVTSKDVKLHLRNTEINDWIQRVLVAHPVFDVVDRLEGKLYGYRTYKPICSMDKTEGYAFDGTEYPLTLNNYWTVLMQYIPLRSSDDAFSSVEEQLQQELENYVVIARRSSHGDNSKDVKIVVATPTTRGQSVEVTMYPPKDKNYPQVSVNNKQITLKQNGDSETFNSLVTVFGLPNKEVYVKVHDAFYIIYDGTRVKITALSTKLRNRVRGLCGTFDGQKSDDFTTPNNCVVRDPEEFIASYTALKEGQEDSHIMSLKSRSQKHCSHKKVPIYVDYIQASEDSNKQPSTSCTRFQTRYVVENGQICFTIRPLSVCKSHCSHQGSVNKNIEVHCVQNKNVASLWKSQIDNGASPDFSQKPVTKYVNLEVPQTCRSS